MVRLSRTGVLALAAALAFSMGGLVATPARAAEADSRWSMQSRFARETTRYGDQDSSAYRIEHVHELQYRLRWAGVYNGPVTGYFGELTRDAVKRFQRQQQLKVTGVAGHATWEQLIPRSVRARAKAPNRCRGPGWNICYDRRRHQSMLWRNGQLWNSWLVRGGARGYETRTGASTVFKRDRDHVSGLYGTAMPYSQFFDGGQAFHGSPFLVDPFVGHSHGCVNMYIEDARQLWKLTVPKRLDVNVYGAWD